MNRVVRTTGWTGGLAAGFAVLVALGERLPTPPLDAGEAWAWLERSDPAVATFTIVRLAATVVVAYLLLATFVVVAADATRAPVLAVLARRLTIPAARRLIGHAAGAGLALSLAATAPTAACLLYTSPSPRDS